MDSPIFSAIDAGALAFDVFPCFFRVSTDSGDILAEYGRAHVVRLTADMVPAGKIPPGGIPRGSIALDRYGNMRQSRRLPIPFCLPATQDNGELIRAILAMKPADVSHLQLDDDGCGPAVVARLTGKSYAESVRTLYPSGKVRILGTQRLAQATGTTRHWCKRNTWAEVKEAGAVAALIKNMDKRGKFQYGHFVSIDPGMVVIDPELVLHYPLAEYPRKTWTPLMYFTRA